MFNKDKYSKFVRFGTLGPVKQSGYKSDTFHSPPTHYGFYCMPYLYQDWFLISSLESFQPHLPFKKNIEPNWDSATDDEIGNYHKIEEYNQKMIKKFAKYFTAPNDCELWHHLTKVPNNEVLMRSGSWIKTSYNTWRKALIKETLNNRMSSSIDGDITTTCKKNGHYSKDYLEVFFDYKIV